LQRLLKGFAGGPPLAKSSVFSQRDWAIHQFPKNARHELLSAALLSTRTDDDLLLHLIATHHGSARPFAEPVTENSSAAAPFTAKLLDAEFQLDSSAQRSAAWNAVLPERFWRVVRKYGWWGAAYREAVFRLADHARSRDEQDRDSNPRERNEVHLPAFPVPSRPQALHPLPLTGLDGANPLAFLAALGTLVVCDRLSRAAGHVPKWLAGPIGLSWETARLPNAPVLHMAADPPSEDEFAGLLAERLSRTIDTHPAACIVNMLLDKEHPLAESIRRLCLDGAPEDRSWLDWVVALACETVPDAASPLQTVRRDYLIGNLRSVMDRTEAHHLQRSLFHLWDFADSLDNQSLHWEPTEDRRHAYQWHMPSGDPTRKHRGGMLGANRLALEAWSLFPSFPNGDRVTTRGFRGTGVRDTYWTWPVWRSVLTVDGVASLLSLPGLQQNSPDLTSLRGFGVSSLFRSQRILVGKTPNLTAAMAVG